MCNGSKNKSDFRALTKSHLTIFWLHTIVIKRENYIILCYLHMTFMRHKLHTNHFWEI